VRPLLAGIIAFFIATGTAASGLPIAPQTLAPAAEAVRRNGCPGVLGALRQAARESTPSGARAAYVLGYCLAAAGLYDDARSAFLEASRRHATLSAYARLGAARAALRAGDASAAADLGRPPAGASPAAAARLRLARAEALLRTGDARGAAVIARVLVRGEHSDEVVAESWWLLGRASASSGDLAAARSAYAMVWWGIPGNTHAGDAGRELRALASGRDPAPTSEARAARGLRLLARWAPREAEGELASAVKGALPPDLAREAWHQLGILRLGSRSAVAALQQAVRLPTARDQSLFWLGLAWLRIGRSAEASATWSALRQRYPDSPWNGRALFTQGRLAEARGQWGHADGLYLQVIDRYPQSPRADEARWRRAWMRLQRGLGAEADALFLRYATSSPGSPRAAAHLYWASRTAGQAQRSPGPLLRQVAERYPLTFYGQRARARLALPPVAQVPSRERRDLDPNRFHPAYEELAALGFDAEAREEIASQLTDDAPAAVRDAAAELYARAGETAKSISAIQPLVDEALYGGRELDGTLWRLAYPRAFWPLVAREADRSGVDPLLVLAVIREESRFDPRAVSPAEAVGLMQLLPATAQGVLGRRTAPAALTDPAVNIRAGTAYLAGLLRRFQGTVPLAVGAYNAGPGALRRHAALARSDVDRFVEELPYAETRAYVQRVMQTYGIYRWLYR
jgi:soluble lytic murein transglycosylase